jgi:CubicO group peptidase (beta-lactamase class C family)
VLGLLGAAPLAAGGLAAAAGDASAMSGRVPADLRPGGAFDRYVKERADQDEFSGTVLLTHRGRTVLSRSYGMADKARSIPNGPDTIFALASVNKLFTGVAVAQLAERGSVAYQGKLGTYLDGFPPEVAQTVTVHHLLTHTSGIGREANSPEPPPGSAEWDTIEEAWAGTLAYLRGLPPGFPPGTRYRYSNDGYFLLKAIVAEVSGQSFHDYLDDHVFAPAGMTSTGVYTREQQLTDPRIAHAYSLDAAGERVDITAEQLIWQAAGDPYSTAPDLVRFAAAMQDGTLLGSAYTHVTVSPKLPLGPGGATFATYAPIARLLGEQWILGHNGGGQGIANNVDWFPGSGWIAVIVGNYDFPGASEPIVSLARQLIAGVHG